MNFSYLFLAVSQCIRGASLLDLVEIYESDIETISLCFLLFSSGSLLGSFLNGFVATKFPRAKLMLMAIGNLWQGLTLALLPLLGTVNLFFAVSIVNGIGMGIMHTSFNAICVELWEGQAKGGPHMHAMHSFYSIGALIGPAVTKPFLSYTTVASQIWILYAIVGLAPLTTSLGLMVFGSMDCCRAEDESRPKEAVETSEDEEKGPVFRKVAFLVIIFLIYSTYVATEMCVGLFIPAFAVLSDLGLDKFEGANLLTAFLAGFCLTRFVIIFVSFKVSPQAILVTNLTTATLGNTILIAFGRTYPAAAFVGYFVIGSGTGSMYANAVNWMQSYIKVDSKVTGLIGVAGCVGAASLPSVMGALIKWHPDSLVYSHFTSNVLLILLFICAGAVGRGLLREGETAKESQKVTKL